MKDVASVETRKDEMTGGDVLLAYENRKMSVKTKIHLVFLYQGMKTCVTV